MSLVLLFLLDLFMCIAFSVCDILLNLNNWIGEVVYLGRACQRCGCRRAAFGGQRHG